VGDILNFLKQAAESGYNGVLCFTGIADAARPEERVAMRVSQGDMMFRPTNCWRGPRAP
jgi:predicted ABC-type ATPase